MHWFAFKGRQPAFDKQFWLTYGGKKASTLWSAGKIGKGSVKVTKGTVVKVDSGAKTVAVKTADGTEKTFDFTETAGKDMGQAVGAGTEKGAKVTVYYTEESGKKIAHFFGF
ncbi:MAG TPA: hypothetical protein VGH37_15735 [Candidatus Acidoferrum sp.]|jgi:hypothetical protein